MTTFRNLKLVLTATILSSLLLTGCTYLSFDSNEEQTSQGANSQADQPSQPQEQADSNNKKADSDTKKADGDTKKATPDDSNEIDVAKAVPYETNDPTSVYVSGQDGDPIIVAKLFTDNYSIRLEGFADVFENNVIVVITNEKTLEEHVGFTVADTTTPKPHAFKYEQENLPSGTYTVNVLEDNPGAGESGVQPYSLSITGVKIK